MIEKNYMCVGPQTFHGLDEALLLLVGLALLDSPVVTPMGEMILYGLQSHTDQSQVV